MGVINWDKYKDLTMDSNLPEEFYDDLKNLIAKKGEDYAAFENIISKLDSTLKATLQDLYPNYETIIDMLNTSKKLYEENERDQMIAEARRVEQAKANDEFGHFGGSSKVTFYKKVDGKTKKYTRVIQVNEHGTKCVKLDGKMIPVSKLRKTP